MDCHLSVENAGVAVEKGMLELIEAKDYRASSRKKKICFVGSGVIVLLIIILVGIFEPTKSIIQ